MYLVNYSKRPAQTTRSSTGEVLFASTSSVFCSRDADIEQRIALFFSERERKFDDDRRRRIIASIKEVLRIEHRIYLNIFKLERDTSLTDTIIKALEKGRTILSNFEL